MSDIVTNILVMLRTEFLRIRSSLRRTQLKAMIHRVHCQLRYDISKVAASRTARDTFCRGAAQTSASEMREAPTLGWAATSSRESGKPTIDRVTIDRTDSDEINARLRLVLCKLQASGRGSSRPILGRSFVQTISAQLFRPTEPKYRRID